MGRWLELEDCCQEESMISNEQADWFRTNAKRAARLIGKVVGDRKLVGVDVGTGRGGSAYYLLKFIPGLFLYTVDMYDLHLSRSSDYLRQWKRDINAKRQSNIETILFVYGRALRRLEPFLGRCELVKASSEEFASRFPRHSLDLVYIDADHLKVARDIEVWFPALKADGFLLGHDWNWPEVQRDVNSFASEFGYTILTNRLGEWLIELDQSGV